MNDRNNIIANIKYVTENLEKNGYFSYNANTIVPLDKLKNFANGIHIVTDEKDFKLGITMWIDCIYNFILENNKDKNLLKIISSEYDQFKWINKFLEIEQTMINNDK